MYEKYTVSDGNTLFWRYMNKWSAFSRYYNKKIYSLQNHVIKDESSLSPISKEQLGDIVGRSLAPIPLECPTPMGMKGKNTLNNQHLSPAK